MNLAEMLLYADINQVNKIADSYNCDCDRHSKTEMIQSLIYTMLNKTNLELLASRITKVEEIFLNLLYIDTRDMYSFEELNAKAKQAISLTETDTDITPRELILSSLKKGWLFQGVGKKYLWSYLVPQDYKTSLLQTIRSNLLKKMNTVEEINLYRDESSLIVSDLTTFLQFVLNEEVLLTGDGNIYKRQQMVLFNMFLVPEEPLKKVSWRFGYGRRYNEYPDRFSLIYDYAYHHKLIHEDYDGFLFLTPLGGKWLNKSEYYVEELKFYQFWIRLYKYTIPFLQLILILIDLVAHKRWIEVQSIEKQLVFWIKEHYYEKKEEIFEDRIIKMLFHLGVLQIGEYDNKRYIRVTDKGHIWIKESTFSKI